MASNDHRWWLDVFYDLQGASSPQALIGKLTARGAGLGFQYCSCGLRAPGPDGAMVTTVVDSYPSGWMDHYRTREYLRVDPTVQLASTVRGPIVWSDAVFSSASQLWDDAQDQGLRVGLAQSCWGRAGSFTLLSLSRDSEPLSRAELKEVEPRLAWLVHSAQQSMLRLACEPSGNPRGAGGLSRRELEVMHWTVEGKTSWEISAILKIAESTVNFHVKNMLVKLGAQNKLQAAVKAVSLGLLSSSDAELRQLGSSKTT